MASTVTLRERGSVVLDGSGNGTVGIGPIGARETWHPDQASVAASTAVKEASCSIYVGDAPTGAFFRDRTISGSTGDSSTNVGGDVPVGWKVWAVWTGGDAGALATLTVTGDKEI